jgi:Beta-galactosidase trimerisation domain
MNRRDFMGSVVSGIALAKFGAGATFGLDAETAESHVAAQGAWIENGLIDAGGSHEPYLFVVRRGGHSLNAREIYRHEQSEEVIRSLMDQGIEVFHTHLYKGFGMAAEKPEMEDTVRTAAIVHRLGMKIDTYIQWDSMMYETFFVEEPRAKDWIQRDAIGQPVMLEYGYQQSFRYLPCFSNQGFIDYLKKVVRFAVTEVKTDFIHFDNFTLSAEPNSCHCNACKTSFRQRLRAKYSGEERKNRFGFENVDYVNPPLWNITNRPEKLEIIADPVFQEWIDYRCQTMADALSQMTELIHSLNPDVVVEINYGGIVGYNSPWIRGTDHARLLPHTQVFWDESDDKCEFTTDGRLITAIRTYKIARTYRNIVLTYISVNEIAIAECLAFNQTIGFAGVSPLSTDVVKYIGFYRKLRDLYAGAEDLAPVAVLRSYASITYNNASAGLSAMLVEQALIQARIPFRLIADEHLTELSPATCKVLILPNVECLSDEQLQAIQRYVAAGGGLVATEQTGLYDAWRRMRVEPGLKDLMDGQLPALGRNQRSAEAIVAGQPQRKTVSRGRTVYIPALEFDGSLPSAQPYFTLGTEFWKRPKNWQDLVDAISWAAGENMPVSVTAPDFVAMNLLEQSAKQRRIIHLVNYDAEKNPSIASIAIRCATPKGEPATAVRFYAPDADDGKPIDFRIEGAEAVFTVPALQTYAVVTVSW